MSDDHIPVTTGSPARRPLQFPREVCTAMFAGAAGRAAIFEIRARIFVDAVPELCGALTSSLEPLIRDLTSWMARETTATTEECERLRRCAKLRNKIFHAEFSRAAGQLVHLNVELEREGVKRFSWDGPVTIENFTRAIDGGGTLVTKTATTEGHVYGWLLNACQTGTFGAAASVFDEGTDLMSRILDDWRAAQVAEHEAARVGSP